MVHPTSTLGRRRILSCFLAMPLIVLLASQVWGGDTWHNMPGTACAAYNNNQANALERSHVRIYNPPSNPQSVWVICPMQRVQEDLQETDNLVRGYINAYFDAQSASSAEVLCIVRDFNYLTIHVPGGTLAGMVNSINVTATRPLNPPGVGFPSWNFTTDDTSFDNYWTVTCKLAPGTGINSIDFYQR